MWRLAVEDLRTAAQVYPAMYSKLRGALESELKDALNALMLVDPMLKARLQSIESNEGIEDAIRDLLAAEQRELGLHPQAPMGHALAPEEGPAGPPRDAPTPPPIMRLPPLFTQPPPEPPLETDSNEGIRVRVHSDGSTAQHGPRRGVSLRTAAAWRRAADAALRTPLLQEGDGEQQLTTQHSIDARTRPGMAAMYALGLWKTGALQQTSDRTSAP